MNIWLALDAIGIIVGLAVILGIVVYLAWDREWQYRQVVTERLRAEEAEAALQVKHQIEHLYTQARDYIRRAA